MAFLLLAQPIALLADADSVQMLTRSSQVGEFYVMMPPQVMPTGGEGSNLHTADMLIYDEESDKHVRIRVAGWEKGEWPRQRRGDRIDHPLQNIPAR